MDRRLITILRAAHCRSTHHFFAVDALPEIQTDPGRRLGSQLLKHYGRYLSGAKAPDKEFRDFRNHVVHVHDNHWGGAPKAAHRWYENLIAEIRQARWADAAYCAGVLSHYFTDPLMPLHTDQSPRESVVHRPLEWSVTKSYDKILARYLQGGHQVVFETAGDDGWLGSAVTRAAELSNRHYQELIDRYDLELGTRRPEEGLDEASIDLLAGLFGVAITGWARIIERAAEQAQAEIPQASLSLASLVASITMPAAWIVRRISSLAERRAIRAIFDEFQTTGQVVANLPPEVRSVRDQRERDRKLDEVAATEPVTTAATASFDRPPTASTPSQTSTLAGVRPDQVTRRRVLSMGHPSPESTGPAPSLAMTDDLVDAPSIGPKTAKRFAGIGITTVEQFLSASADSMARGLSTRWIKPELVRDWQDQARLVTTVPGLCGYKAQLLVGAQCRDRETLAAEAPSSLHQRIERFAATNAGKRALRSSRLPTQDDVAEWISHAANGPARRSA